MTTRPAIRAPLAAAMNKDPESWARVFPKAVLSGSNTQAINVLTMALQDIAAQSNKIATLLAENDALRARVETARNDALEEAAKIVDCISPEFPKSAATLIDAIRVLKAPTQ